MQVDSRHGAAISLHRSRAGKLTSKDDIAGVLARDVSSAVSIEWIDTVRDWAQEQAAAAPPLTAEAARLICGAYAAYTSLKNMPSDERPERPTVPNANSDQSRQAG